MGDLDGLARSGIVAFEGGEGRSRSGGGSMRVGRSVVFGLFIYFFRRGRRLGRRDRGKRGRAGPSSDRNSYFLTGVSNRVSINTCLCLQFT